MIVDEVVLVCVLAMAELVGAYGGNMPQKPPTYAERFDVCVAVGRKAAELEWDGGGLYSAVTVAVAVAQEESAFTSPLSKAGAMGPMQIIPRYHCPGPDGVVAPSKRRGVVEGCDLVDAGVKALRWFWLRYDRDWSQALCHYNSGTKCGSGSRRYAKRVLRRHRRLEAQTQAAMTRMGER